MFYEYITECLQRYTFDLKRAVSSLHRNHHLQFVLNGSTQVVINFNISGKKNLKSHEFTVTFILLDKKNTVGKKADGKSVVQSYLDVKKW